MLKERLHARLIAHGQEHLLAFWERLDTRRQRLLAEQIDEIDFELIRRLHADGGRRSDVRELIARSEPPPAIRLKGLPAGELRRARLHGQEAIRAGRIGAILVAGGQGTRLGFDRPKGMFPIGPLSKKTLFQILVEKLAAAARRYEARIPLYLMTSPATHDETAAFFAEHDRFGLPAEDLVIFCQGTMPAVDAESGRVLLEDHGRIAASPDGHGGMPAAMARGGALDDVLRRGIEHLFYFQVDNPLVDVCSPEMIGHHLSAESELTTQVVAKTDPLERVGNVVRAGGRLHVIEYSDLPDEAARRRNPDGSLTIWAGSIAVHVIAAELLRRSVESAETLPFHTARKAVPHVDRSGRRVEPETPNAIKFERFIFDLMPEARNAIVVEVDRRSAFAPLKNAPGAAADTPEMVRQQMAALHREWLRAAGAEVADDVPVEISPLLALDAEQLAERIPLGTRIAEPTYFPPLELRCNGMRETHHNR
ncbi:MAG: UDPGP type 1 family protein [Pirellulaceae bacterium]|nr:UDPGP type 1 family protein [Pirellulaceae bacterium]